MCVMDGVVTEGVGLEGGLSMLLHNMTMSMGMKRKFLKTNKEYVLHIYLSHC
jgi:hypothetical protein